MKKTHHTINRLVLGAFLAVMFHHGQGWADEGQSFTELNKKIEALQKRVEELESEKKNAWSSQQQWTPRGSMGWDPFDQINQMQQEMDRMFQDSFGRPGAKQGMFSSSMSFGDGYDLKETSDGYEIRFDVTGFDKDKLDVQINEHAITIKGEMSREDKTEGLNQLLRSQQYGTFMRSIPVPADADVSNVKTEKEKDSLIVRLPKKESGLKKK